MHIFGLMTQVSTLKQLDEVVISANMVFSSSHSAANVEKHFRNLQVLLTKGGPCAEDTLITNQNYEVSFSSLQLLHSWFGCNFWLFLTQKFESSDTFGFLSFSTRDR